MGCECVSGAQNAARSLKAGRHDILLPLGIRRHSRDACILIPYDYDAEGAFVKIPSASYRGKGEALIVATDDGGSVLPLQPLLGFGAQAELRSGASSLMGAFAEAVRSCGIVPLMRENLVSSEGPSDKVAVLYRDGRPWDVGVAAPCPDDGCRYARVPLSSVSGGLFPVAAATPFFNVRGSTGDTYPVATGGRGRNWLAFWTANVGTAAAGCTAAGSAGIPCTANGTLYGGHVVLAGSPTSPAPGSNHVAFILPICPAHNNWRNTAMMRAAYATVGVWLDSYRL